MGFRLIEGGLSTRSAEKPGVGATAVAEEGRRRVSEARHELGAVCSRISGTGKSASIDYFRLQIEYVVKVLSSLDPVPADFRHDMYWPEMRG